MERRIIASVTRTQGPVVQTSSSVRGIGETGRRSPKVSGAIINVGGKIFRKATPHAVLSWSIQPGAPQSSKATWKRAGYADQPVTITSTPGGPEPDAPSWPQLYSGIVNPNTGMNPFGSFPSIPSSMRDEAETKALLNLVSDSANLGENLATMGQTLRMIANPTKYLADELVQVYREKQFRPFLRRTVTDILTHNPGDIARRYLEYVYGWRPLMQDIHTLVQVAKDTSVKPLLIRGRGESSRYAAHPVTEYNGSSRTRIQFNTKSKVRCNLWAKVDPNHQGIRALNQLGLANPRALAWELMSWSFVVDWILPIGAVLNALTASSGLVWVDGSVANRIKGRGSYTQVAHFGTRDFGGVHNDATGTLIYDGYNRVPLSGFPKPGLWIDQDPFRGDRPFKAAALAVAQLGVFR